MIISVIGMYPKGLAAGFEPGWGNWMHKFGKSRTLGRPLFQGRPQDTQISTINIHLLT